MDHQNVTLSIPKDILRKAKHIAIERGISLSGLLTQLLVELTTREDEYRKTRERHLAVMGEFNMETGGSLNLSREELHGR